MNKDISIELYTLSEPTRNEKDSEKEEIPLWSELEEVYANKLKDPNGDKTEGYRHLAISEGIHCPQCGKDAHKLDIFYFRNSDFLWKHFCGREGYFIACMSCGRKVAFFLISMS